MKSFGQILDEHKGQTNGFHYLRLALAVGVLVHHSVDICYGAEAAAEIQSGIFKTFHFLLVPLFFGVSGFLVTGSLERIQSTWAYFSLRALRILPGLIVEIITTAFILGPLLTTFPLAIYFKQLLTSDFLPNSRTFMGNISFLLPGVFQSNPYPEVVNGSLWSVPWEVDCYILLGLLASFGCLKQRALTVKIYVIFCLLGFFLTMPIIRPFQFRWHEAGGRVAVPAIMLCFFGGMLLYLFRFEVRHSFALFLIALITTVLCVKSEEWVYIVTISIAYVATYLGLLHPRKIIRGDYSYGIYIYAFPIQQTLRYLFPYIQFYPHIFLSLILSLLCSMLSWHFIEKKALFLKAYIYRFSIHNSLSKSNASQRENA